ncbi:MAG: hypothetical protein ACI8XO_003758 [Verrucomicrobiales bacterium]|jgi:uncharacterized protein (DUF1501 family)
MSNKTDNDSDFLTRRHFFRQGACAALGVTGMVNTLTHLRLIGGAMAQDGGTGGGHKAIVCLYLQGGNDSSNMILPMGPQPVYDQYASDRGDIAIDLEDADGNLLVHPITPDSYDDGVDYAFHPSAGDLAQLFADGNLAVVANVGSMVGPISKPQYQQGLFVPPQLYSHSDQTTQWQSSVADQPFQTGWGGRMADELLKTLNANQKIAMSVSLSGTNSYQVGDTSVQYQVTPNGSVSYSGYGTNYANALEADGVTYKNTLQGKRLKAFHDIMNLDPAHLMQKELGTKMYDSYLTDRLLTEALSSVPPLTTEFPDSASGDQMKMIARLIAARSELGQERQIFFAQVKGYDTHATQLTSHAALMAEMSETVKAFYDATVELGIEDQVTTFTASDFSRTYSPNGVGANTGSDHAWGGHALVCGGAVNGREIYGQMPDLQINGPSDVDLNNGRGRWLPTTSVDEYSATLAKWFGVDPAILPVEVFPNLGRFANPDLGFMA